MSASAGTGSAGTPCSDSSSGRSPGDQIQVQHPVHPGRDQRVRLAPGRAVDREAVAVHLDGRAREDVRSGPAPGRRAGTRRPARPRPRRGPTAVADGAPTAARHRRGATSPTGCSGAIVSFQESTRSKRARSAPEAGRRVQRRRGLGHRRRRCTPAAALRSAGASSPASSAAATVAAPQRRRRAGRSGYGTSGGHRPGDTGTPAHPAQQRAASHVHRLQRLVSTPAACCRRAAALIAFSLRGHRRLEAAAWRPGGGRSPRSRCAPPWAGSGPRRRSAAVSARTWSKDADEVQLPDVADLGERGGHPAPVEDAQQADDGERPSPRGAAARSTGRSSAVRSPSGKCSSPASTSRRW